MKNILKSKKGFTLVELLAVIVILALLIVITANTVLPMMNKSKEKGLVVEAQHVLNLASAEYQVDKMSDAVPANGYSVEKLTGNDNYVGCITVSATDTEYQYKFSIYDTKNKIFITSGSNSINLNAVENPTSAPVDDYTTDPTLACNS